MFRNKDDDDYKQFHDNEGGDKYERMSSNTKHVVTLSSFCCCIAIVACIWLTFFEQPYYNEYKPLTSKEFN